MKRHWHSFTFRRRLRTRPRGWIQIAREVRGDQARLKVETAKMGLKNAMKPPEDAT